MKEYQRLDALSKSSTSLTPQEAQRKRELKAVLDHYFQEEKPHAPPTPPPTYNTPQTQEVDIHSPLWPEAQVALLHECKSLLQKLLPLEATRRQQTLSPTQEEIYSQCIDTLFRRFGMQTSLPTSPLPQEYPTRSPHPPPQDHNLSAERPYIRVRRKKTSFSKR
ncbi:MAG TPA: hypothetical protein DCE42_11475 [Myxococcales bacterium]|nr:hypothetical protein [Myxococcales bacterium]